MAMTYNKKLQEQMQGQLQPNQTQTRNQQQTVNPSAASQLTGESYKKALRGTSETTNQQLAALQAGYKPSETVNAAMNALQQLQGNKPGSYSSQYANQLSSIYDQITNRKPFQYDLNGDMLYQQYKDQYTLNGQQAMMDTIGQAAQYTGGYGSSYGATAGNQAYQQYLTQLNNIIPSLYDRAAARYDQEGQDLLNQYNLAFAADQSDYGRWLDTLNQWNTDLNNAMNAYNTLYNQDYGQYSDMMNYWQNQAQLENADYNNQQSSAYSMAMTMLSSGAMPSAELLAASGISQADAAALLAALSPKPSGGGSGSGTRKPDTEDEDDEEDGGTGSDGSLGGLTFQEINMLNNMNQAGANQALANYAANHPNTISGTGAHNYLPMGYWNDLKKKTNKKKS